MLTFSQIVELNVRSVNYDVKLKSKCIDQIFKYIEIHMPNSLKFQISKMTDTILIYYIVFTIL